MRRAATAVWRNRPSHHSVLWLGSCCCLASVRQMASSAARAPTQQSMDFELDALEDLVLADGHNQHLDSPDAHSAATTADAAALASPLVGSDAVTEDGMHDERTVLAQLLDVLPLDGASLPLSVVSRGVNVENIALRWGSLLKFVQRFPLHLVVTSSPNDSSGGNRARWYVARRERLVHPRASTNDDDKQAAQAGDASLRATTGDTPESLRIPSHRNGEPLRANEELVTSPSPSIRGDTQSDDNKSEELCLIIRQKIIGNDQPQLPLHELQRILEENDSCSSPGLLRRAEARYGSLRKFVRYNAAARSHFVIAQAKLHVRLRDSCTAEELHAYDEQLRKEQECKDAAVRSQVDSEQARHRTAALPVIHDADFATDSWEVELELDNEEEPASEGEDAQSLQPPSVAATTVTPRPSSAGDVGGETTAAAPAEPPTTIERSDDAATASSPSPEFKSAVKRIRIPSSPSAASASRAIAAPPPHLSAAGAIADQRRSLAIQGGASQGTSAAPALQLKLIDLLLEVVPTFPIPLKALRVSDALAQALGPATPVARAIKKFPSLFCYDALRCTVCVHPHVVHKGKGKANALYVREMRDVTPSSKGPALTMAGTTTPVRPATTVPTSERATALPVDVKLGVQRQRQPPQTSAAQLLQTPGAERIWSLPVDRFVSISGLRDDILREFLTTHFKELVAQTVLNTVDDHSDECRLRPLWLSPSALHEFGAEESPVTLSESMHEVILSKLNPCWTPVDKWLSRLPPNALEALRVSAMRDHHSCAAHVPPSVQERLVLVRYLRRLGRSIWVSLDGTRVRKFRGVLELDDLEHPVLPLLHASLPVPESTRASAGMVDLEAHIREKTPFAAVLCEAFVVAGCAETHQKRFVLRDLASLLQRHPTRFVVEEQQQSVGNGCVRWSVGRYSPFRQAATVATTTVGAPPRRSVSVV